MKNSNFMMNLSQSLRKPQTYLKTETDPVAEQRKTLPLFSKPGVLFIYYIGNLQVGLSISTLLDSERDSGQVLPVS